MENGVDIGTVIALQKTFGGSGGGSSGGGVLMVNLTVTDIITADKTASEILTAVLNGSVVAVEQVETTTTYHPLTTAQYTTGDEYYFAFGNIELYANNGSDYPTSA